MPIHGTIKGAAETGKRKAIRLTATAFIGTVVAMFIAFSVIHMSKVNSKMESWDANYKQIEEEMQAFKDVSDAKTIRLYIKELNAMYFYQLLVLVFFQLKKFKEKINPENIILTIYLNY